VPRTLITGGAGFIGSWLAESLLAEGDDVIVLDDLSTGRQANLARIATHTRFTLVVGNACRDSTIAPLVAQVDRVIHLAATVGVQLVLNASIQTIENTVMSTMSVLRAAATHRRPVLITSTSEVYGYADRMPFREDDTLFIGSPTVGRWSYSCAKLLDEFLAVAYSREYGLPIIITRLFNTIGPKQRGEYGMVLPRFISAAQMNEPLYVYGNGQQTRSFCDVRDVVAALIGLINFRYSNEIIVNIGNPEEISILSLAERVIHVLNSRSVIEMKPYNLAYGVNLDSFEDIPRRLPDISKIHKMTGWQPKIDLNESIRFISAYM
jgi:UDP-glucose 4-epimerase